MSDPVLIPRIKALVGGRAFFVTLLLGSLFFFEIEYLNLPHPRLVSAFIASLYGLTILYVILLNRIRNTFLFAYVQLIGDVIASIVLIALTGGIESWFSFVMLLTILSSSIILNKKAGYVIASLSSFLYGALVDLQFYKALPIKYGGVISEKEFFYNIFIHIIAFYFTAYLGGYLSSRLEKTLETLREKDIHLKDLEFFNLKVIESLPSGLFTTDTEGKVALFNRAAETITGVRRQDIIGRSIEGALPFMTYPFEYGRQEKTLITGDRERKTIGITISVIRDTSGKETGVIGTFQDLTQLKMLEAEMQQREKWAVIGELSANIAHEIRNPLASLKGSIEMLREEKVPEKHRKRLMDIALGEMERLNEIITDFLTYSRPKPLEIEPVDLHLLLEDTLALLINAKKGDGEIRIRKDFGGPLSVNADPHKMRQVVWNLGVNAIEAMPRGGELTVSTRSGQEGVSIAISDTGPGISPGDLEKIFYPFFTTKEQGTGLGLSIAYRVIEEHGGRITATSDPGIRTTFEIILPRNYERS